MSLKTPKDYDQALLSLVRKKGIVRSRDLIEHKIPRVYLSRLCDKGLLTRMSRGLYDSQIKILDRTNSSQKSAIVCLTA